MNSDKENLHTKTQQVWRQQRPVHWRGPPKICLNLFIHSLLLVGSWFFKWVPPLISFSKLDASEACTHTAEHLHIIHWPNFTHTKIKNLNVSQLDRRIQVLKGQIYADLNPKEVHNQGSKTMLCQK